MENTKRRLQEINEESIPSGRMSMPALEYKSQTAKSLLNLNRRSNIEVPILIKSISDEKYNNVKKKISLFDVNSIEESIFSDTTINQILEDKFKAMKFQILDCIDKYRDLIEKKYDSHIDDIKNIVSYKTKRIADLLKVSCEEEKTKEEGEKIKDSSNSSNSNLLNFRT